MEECRTEKVTAYCADLDRLRDDLNQLAGRVKRTASNESQGGNENDQQASLVIRGR